MRLGSIVFLILGLFMGGWSVAPAQAREYRSYTLGGAPVERVKVQIGTRGVRVNRRPGRCVMFWEATRRLRRGKPYMQVYGRNHERQPWYRIDPWEWEDFDHYKVTGALLHTPLPAYIFYQHRPAGLCDQVTYNGQRLVQVQVVRPAPPKPPPRVASTTPQRAVPTPSRPAPAVQRYRTKTWAQFPGDLFKVLFVGFFGGVFGLIYAYPIATVYRAHSNLDDLEDEDFYLVYALFAIMGALLMMFWFHVFQHIMQGVTGYKPHAGAGLFTAFALILLNIPVFIVELAILIGGLLSSALLTLASPVALYGLFILLYAFFTKPVAADTFKDRSPEEPLSEEEGEQVDDFIHSAKPDYSWWEWLIPLWVIRLRKDRVKKFREHAEAAAEEAAAAAAAATEADIQATRAKAAKEHMDG